MLVCQYHTCKQPALAALQAALQRHEARALLRPSQDLHDALRLCTGADHQAAARSCCNARCSELGDHASGAPLRAGGAGVCCERGDVFYHVDGCGGGVNLRGKMQRSNNGTEQMLVTQ